MNVSNVVITHDGPPHISTTFLNGSHAYSKCVVTCNLWKCVCVCVCHVLTYLKTFSRSETHGEWMWSPPPCSQCLNTLSPLNMQSTNMLHGTITGTITSQTVTIYFLTHLNGLLKLKTNVAEVVLFDLFFGTILCVCWLPLKSLSWCSFWIRFQSLLSFI